LHLKCNLFQAKACNRRKAQTSPVPRSGGASPEQTKPRVMGLKPPQLPHRRGPTRPRVHGSLVCPQQHGLDIPSRPAHTSSPWDARAEQPADPTEGLKRRHRRGGEQEDEWQNQTRREGGKEETQRKGWRRGWRGRLAGGERAGEGRRQRGAREARRRQAVFINFLLGCIWCHSSEIMEPLHTLLNNSICEESKCVSEHSYAS